MMKNKALIPIFLIFALAVAWLYTGERNTVADKDNILHLPFNEEHGAKAGSVSPPWINNGFVYYLLFRPLILANSDLTSFSPSLAQNYSVSSDGLQYTFQLRENASWADGEEVTVNDVMFSLEAAMFAATIDPLYHDAFLNIRNIETVGLTNTISIKLREPDQSFLNVLSQFLILPKHLLDEDTNDLSLSPFWENPIGTGMYILAEKTEDVYILKQNPYYIGKKPNIKEVHLHREQNPKLDVFMSSDVLDIVNNRSMLRHYIEYKLPISFFRYFAFNVAENSAIQDIELRAAIIRAIDSQQILDNIYLNIGELTITYEGKPIYDIEQAFMHLEKAQYDIQRPIKIAYYFDDSTTNYFMQTIAKNLEAIGLKTELIKGNSLHELLQERNFDILVKDLTVLYPLHWYLELHTKNPHSAIYGFNEVYDLLIDSILQTDDLELQKEYYHKLESLAIEEAIRYPIINLNHALFLSPRVELPNKFKFGNPWYILDLEFENWRITKK